MSEQEKKKIGAVMVVGGGITGMQSALDLANSGFKVYLVEKTTSIGGTDVPAGQDFSHQRLLYVHDFAQTDRGGQTPQYRTYHQC